MRDALLALVFLLLVIWLSYCLVRLVGYNVEVW